MGVTSACRECLKNIYKIAFDWKLLIQKTVSISWVRSWLMESWSIS